MPAKGSKDLLAKKRRREARAIDYFRAILPFEARDAPSKGSMAGRLASLRATTADRAKEALRADFDAKAAWSRVLDAAQSGPRVSVSVFVSSVFASRSRERPPVSVRRELFSVPDRRSPPQSSARRAEPRRKAGRCAAPRRKRRRRPPLTA